MQGGSRRLEGSGTIKRPQQYEHINTTYLQHSKTIQAVNYYNRRKKQLKVSPSNQVIINLTNRNALRDDLKDHIETIFQSTKSINPYIQNYIKEVRVEPVINDNKFTNFNQQLYPLNEDQKVKVLQQKYFPLQNYYNYILDLELHKEIFSVINQPDSKINIHRQSDIISKDNQNSLKDQYQYAIQDIIQQKSIVKDKKIKGFYQSKFQPTRSTKPIKNNKPVKQFVPKLKQTESFDSSAVRFTVNQKQRMELSKRN